MKKYSLFALCAVVSLSQVAIAQPYSGFYGGLHLGSVQVNTTITDYDALWDYGAYSLTGTELGYGFELGYNHRIGKNGMIGVALDGMFSDYAESRIFDTGNGLNEANIDFLTTLRFKGGVLLENTLLYMTGGLAEIQTDYTFGTSSSEFMRKSEWILGYTVGVGIEFALEDNWTMKFEYQRVTTDSETTYQPGYGALDFDAEMNLMRLGLNYQF